MAKRVLVPLDGTKNAEAALASLEALCDPTDEVVLLAVKKPESPFLIGSQAGRSVRAGISGSGSVTGAPITPDVPVYGETAEQAVQAQVNETKDYLEGLARTIRDKVPHVETVVLVEDNPDDAIIDYATEMRPTFIAMLRRSHPGFADRLLGSVASKIVRSEIAPVLFVPPRDE